MHSKIPTADQVLAFMAEWQDTCPVVIVPTTYYRTPTRVFEEAGVSLVIWANHLMRSSITAMQRTAARIHEEQSLLTVQDKIASIDEVFRLQDVAELKLAEREYLPANGAAGDGATRHQRLDSDDLGVSAPVVSTLFDEARSEEIRPGLAREV
jgi:phosphoenolpyruvate phosphomutase